MFKDRLRWQNCSLAIRDWLDCWEIRITGECSFRIEEDMFIFMRLLQLYLFKWIVLFYRLKDLVYWIQFQVRLSPRLEGWYLIRLRTIYLLLDSIRVRLGYLMWGRLEERSSANRQRVWRGRLRYVNDCWLRIGIDSRDCLVECKGRGNGWKLGWNSVDLECEEGSCNL